jgi:Fe-S-cluster formation regulator IscX/YfhJ
MSNEYDEMRRALRLADLARRLHHAAALTEAEGQVSDLRAIADELADLVMEAEPTTTVRLIDSFDSTIVASEVSSDPQQDPD